MCDRIKMLLLFCLAGLPMACGAEPPGISGTVFDHEGAPLSEAPIQLINKETGTEHQTRSAADGSYVIGDIPAGVYTVAIAMPCCELKSFMKEDLEIGADGLRFEIHMVEGLSLHTFGDDPATIADLVRARQEIPDLPTPELADGKPDLSGVWLIGIDPFPSAPNLTEWAAGITEQHIASLFRNSPNTRCLPEGIPIPGAVPPFMGKFVQTDDLLLILFEAPPGFRQVFLDGRAHPIDPNPSWTGHSIGEWDGDTLVVDTVGFNDRIWLGPHPVTETMHMVERYRRTDYGVMEVRVTYEDPVVFNEPWVENRVFDLAPQEELMEYVCENNKWATAYNETD